MCRRRNLSVDTGKDVWVVVNSAEDASVFYEEPEGAVVAESKAGETEEPMAAEGDAGTWCGGNGCVCGTKRKQGAGDYFGGRGDSGCDCCSGGGR